MPWVDCGSLGRRLVRPILSISGFIAALAQREVLLTFAGLRQAEPRGHGAAMESGRSRLSSVVDKRGVVAPAGGFPPLGKDGKHGFKVVLVQHGAIPERP
jgi:hypothetical protein